MKRHPLDGLLAALAHAALGAPRVVLAGALALTVIMGLAARPLTIRPDVGALLPEDSGALEAGRELRRRLGGSDVLIVTLRGPDTRAFRERLGPIAEAISSHPHVRTVEWHLDLSPLRRNVLILVPPVADLEAAERALTARVRRGVQEALGLFADPEEADEQTASGPKADADPFGDLLDQLDWAVDRDREYFEARDHTAISLLAFPTESPRDVSFARRLLADLQPLVEEAVRQQLGGLGPDAMVQQVILSGRYRTIPEEAGRLWRGVRRTGLPLLGLWLLLLGIYLRSRVAFLVTVLPPLVTGVTFLGMVSFTMGDLDLMSLAVAPLILTQGVMIGIYLWRTYGEARGHGWSMPAAVEAVLAAPGRRSLVASVAAAVALAPFSASALPGLSRLGWLAMTFALAGALISLLVGSALIAFFDPPPPATKRDPQLKGAPLAVSIIIAALAGAIWAGPRLSLNTDLRNMGTASAGRKAISLLGTGAPTVRAPIVLLTEDARDASFVRRQIPVQRLAPEPEGEGDGRSIIGGAAALSDVLPQDQERRLLAARRICKWLRRKGELLSGRAAERLRLVLAHCDPVALTPGDLPRWVRRQFTDHQGRLGAHVFVFPRGSSLDGERALALLRWSRTLRSRDGNPPLASGSAFIWGEVLERLSGAQWVIWLAPLVAGVVCWLLTGRWRHSVLMVAGPALTTGLLIGGLTLVGRPLAVFDLMVWPAVFLVSLLMASQRAGGSSPWWLGGLLAICSSGLLTVGHGGLASAGAILLVALVAVTLVEWALRGLQSIPGLAPRAGSRP